MTRADQHQALKVFSRDYTREVHNLLAADLGRSPQFVFQQLYNRLQWRVTEGEVAERMTKEAARRCAPGRLPWLHLRTRQRESEALIRTFAGHDSPVLACAFSPDGRRLVSGSSDETLKLWDAETGSCEATLEGHDNNVWACGFSPDGRRIVSASYDNTLKVWNAETGACEATLEGHNGSVNACALSPDGRRIISASSDQTLKLWDVEAGSEFASLPTPYSLPCVAVHPARPWLAFGDSGGVLSVVDLHGLEWGGAEGAAPLQSGRRRREQADVWWRSARDSHETDTVGGPTTEFDDDRKFDVNSEALAHAVHELCRELCHRMGWPAAYDVDYAELPDDVKADNIAAAARIPRVLALVGLAVVSEDDSSNLPQAQVLSIIEADIELLAEAEHDGWREQKYRNDWSYSPVRDDSARMHPCLVQYATLSNEEKEKDRNAVRHYPDIVELAGCRIVAAGGPVRADTR